MSIKILLHYLSTTKTVLSLKNMYYSDKQIYEFLANSTICFVFTLVHLIKYMCTSFIINNKHIIYVEIQYYM